MYAHQVIDNFRKAKKKDNCSCSHCLKTYEYFVHVVDFIKSSTSFHFGDIDDFVNLEDGKKYVYQSLTGCLPFERCWFDYNTDEKKYGGISRLGFLAHSINGGSVVLQTFLYHKADGKWDYFPFIPAIKLENDTENFAWYALPVIPKDFEATKFQEWWQYWIPRVFALSLQLLNCKNITTEKVYPPEKLNRKRRMLKKQPLFTYHTLVIKPTGKRQESIPKHLWENRIHLCRGHFKTYTTENPLFGRYTGRYWWQPAVRGNKNLGVVMKDYRVEPEMATA